jgi:hypothetical protein
MGEGERNAEKQNIQNKHEPLLLRYSYSRLGHHACAQKEETDIARDRMIKKMFSTPSRNEGKKPCQEWALCIHSLLSLTERVG